jgi:hypothetical protein
VKRRRGNRKNIPAIKDCNGRIVTDALEKAIMFNFYYSTVLSSEGNILHIQGENTGNPFTTDIKTIMRRIKEMRKNTSVGPDRVSGEILKMGLLHESWGKRSNKLFVNGHINTGSEQL